MSEVIRKTLQWFFDNCYDTDEMARCEEALAALTELEQQLAETERMVSLETRQAVEIGELRRRIAELEQQDTVYLSKVIRPYIEFSRRHAEEQQQRIGELEQELEAMRGRYRPRRWQEGSES